MSASNYLGVISQWIIHSADLSKTQIHPETSLSVWVNESFIQSIQTPLFLERLNMSMIEWMNHSLNQLFFEKPLIHIRFYKWILMSEWVIESSNQLIRSQPQIHSGMKHHDQSQVIETQIHWWRKNALESKKQLLVYFKG